MGRFIISRSAAGERFLLQSANGQVLATSRTYANLDACKKGIASLIVHAPIMPVRDLTVGEGGPNPKCEIVASGTGFAYRVKAANGKVVVSSATYATKKACLRAIAMLRNGVEEYEILFERQAGLVPLVMKPPAGARPKTDHDTPKSPIHPVGGGALDAPRSPTLSTPDDTPTDLPKSLTKTKKKANGVENALLDLPAPDEIEETAAGPTSVDLLDVETAADLTPVDPLDVETAQDVPEMTKTTENGAQNADLAAEPPDAPQSPIHLVGTGVPDCPPSPTRSAGNATSATPRSPTTSVGGGALDAPQSPIHLVGTGVPDCPPSPTHSADNATPHTPQKPEVKTPRLVRLTPERPKAASEAPKTPPKKRGLFDRFFKK